MFPLDTRYPIIKHYIIEILLLVVALLITIVSIAPYLQQDKTLPQTIIPTTSNETIEPSPTTSRITVDLSGAILKPDIYEVTEGARLADVVKLAGGLDTEADTGYIARNFNMAQYVTDQEKIYIPFKKDIQDGRFVESPKLLEYTNTTQTDTSAQPHTSSEATELTISINSATKDELDMLPGVGPTTAQKIIDNRPYAALEELLNKKVVKQSVFDDIQDQISL